MTSISISQAKDNLTRIIREVETSHTPIELTRHGKGAAVILAMEDYLKLSETRPAFLQLMENFNKEYGSVKLADRDLENLRASDMGREIEL